MTDAGLVHLRRLTKLELLLLDHTPVSDAGLEHLKGLTALRSLDLSETRVTAAGVAGLTRAVPQVQVLTRRSRRRP